ncbi:MAG: hypothetical protein LBD58_01715 [Treponema sp.]|nr:hypothetical protein [Treponema sp.]
MSYKENHIKIKPSFIMLFTMSFVGATTVTTISIIVLSFINVSSITNRQIETLAKERTSRLQKDMARIPETHEDPLSGARQAVSTHCLNHTKALSHEMS